MMLSLKIDLHHFFQRSKLYERDLNKSCIYLFRDFTPRNYLQQHLYNTIYQLDKKPYT